MLVLVILVRIAGHGEGAVDQDEHRQLAGARALHLGIDPHRAELRWLPVDEAARREVGSAGQSTRKGEGGLVFGRLLGAPEDIVFVPLDALARDLVGPGAFQAGGLERAMEVDQ